MSSADRLVRSSPTLPSRTRAGNGFKRELHSFFAKFLARSHGFPHDATARNGIGPSPSARQGCSASATNGVSIAPLGRAPRWRSEDHYLRLGRTCATSRMLAAAD
jgi:hypothetical protein